MCLFRVMLCMDGTVVDTDNVPNYKSLKYNIFPTEADSSIKLEFDSFLIDNILRKPKWFEESLLFKNLDGRERLAFLKSWFESSLWRMLSLFVIKGKEWGVTRNLFLFAL